MKLVGDMFSFAMTAQGVKRGGSKIFLLGVVNRLYTTKPPQIAADRTNAPSTIRPKDFVL